MHENPCPEKTRTDLEWDRVLEALAERCVGAAGKRLARALPFAEGHAAVTTALAEVSEAVALDAVGEPLPLGELADVEAAVAGARIGATLHAEELREVVALLGSARVLRRFLTTRRARAERLFAACATDPALDGLEQTLASAFDPDGSLADRASPRLASLRAECRAARERLVRRLDELLAKHANVLQDGYWTERDGRYVLPVRSDAHDHFPGIVHATSSSGATLFIEPHALVEHGNRLKMVGAEVVREEEAIYVALSARVAGAVESLAAASRALAHADVRAAACKLTRDLALTFPVVPAPGDGEPAIELRAARHPLLALDGIDVVPSDLSMEAGHAVVVSGPNAGGKTVALKTLGLAALMVRAGLPVPAGEGSRVSVFELVLTDVGDDQNLRKNLSTFSAHVRNIAGVLDTTSSGVLVLLDELAGGTDPREGEALAAAVLDSLCARGGAVACTTHYEGLKALALADPRFVNASVGFDLATMSPTFRLAMGIPGASSALAVARRFGIPSTVLDCAQRFLSSETVSFEAMVEKLASERRALELAREVAEREAETARARQRELERAIESLEAREGVAITRAGEELLQSVRRAREELRAAQARLRSGKLDEKELRGAAKTIDSVAGKAALGGELEARAELDANAHRSLAPGELRVGARVYVPRLRVEADVLEVNPSGVVRVAAGSLKLTTSASELLAAAAPTQASSARASSRRNERAAQRAVYDAAADPDVPMQTTENTVDLRGLRVHEVLGMAEQFLDRSLGAGLRVAFLIHGHGTGALRDTLRDALRSSRYVARLRSGEPREGGDGVTVVWLR